MDGTIDRLYPEPHFTGTAVMEPVPIQFHPWQSLIATPYLQGWLNEMRDEEAAAHEFQVFNGFSKGKLTAGYAWDSGIHGRLCKERTWRVIPLKSDASGERNTQWKLPHPDDIVPSHQLREQSG
jgi:hypothetical protein